MLDIFVRIKSVDMDGYNGRDNHPTKEMEGLFVRITNMDTIPEGTANEDMEGDPSYQVFSGIVVDANGEDVEDGEITLIDYEIETLNNIPVLFGRKER
jgi:hypothetical protein